MMNRRAKRDVIVIDDEEAKREQPPEKIVKEEAESVPSPDVAQLQQQLLKSDEKFKRVCKMAGEYKARVEFLENIIDTKEGIVSNANREESTDELRKKMAELTKQLEEREARERIEQPQKSISMMQPPPPDEKPILKVAGDSTNILQSCDSTMPESISYSRARRTLHHHISKCDMEPLIALCANELFDCQDCGENNLDANQVFVHFLSTGHTEKMSDRHVSLAAISYWKVKLTQAESKVTIHNVCNPTNIFQLCRSDAPASVTIHRARELLKVLPRTPEMGAYVSASGPDMLHCEVCNVNPKMPGGICHLFSSAHSHEVNAVGADSISLTAVNYWIQLFGQREEAAAFWNVRQLKIKEKKSAVEAEKEAAAAARKARKHQRKLDAAAAAASVDSKKEIVKIEND